VYILRPKPTTKSIITLEHYFFAVVLTMCLRVADLNLQETLWYAVHFLDLKGAFSCLGKILIEIAGSCVQSVHAPLTGTHQMQCYERREKQWPWWSSTEEFSFAVLPERSAQSPITVTESVSLVTFKSLILCQHTQIYIFYSKSLMSL